MIFLHLQKSINKHPEAEPVFMKFLGENDYYDNFNFLKSVKNFKKMLTEISRIEKAILIKDIYLADEALLEKVIEQKIKGLFFIDRFSHAIVLIGKAVDNPGRNNPDIYILVLYLFQFFIWFSHLCNIRKGLFRFVFYLQ